MIMMFDQIDLHTPLLLGPNGEKLSKQSGAQALDTSEPLTALNRAAEVLGLPVHTGGVARALETWVGLWPFSGALYNPSP